MVTGNIRLLQLTYLSTEEQPTALMMPAVEAMLDELRRFRAISDVHANDGEYTWFKLNEWMQVEIMQIYGKSLTHTPWYRFPYPEFLKIYFTTLYKESQIVKNLHGTAKAFSSVAFITSFVPGIIMTLLMSQLQLMALPLKALPESTGFGESYDADKMVEELVVYAPQDLTLKDWLNVDGRIGGARKLVDKLYVVSSPTFLHLTGVLKNIATKLLSARVLEISSQSVVQVRVQVGTANQEALLQSLEGVSVMFQYKFPVDGSTNPPGTMVSLKVQVPYLLSAIRVCLANKISVEQVYDFYA